MKKKHLILLLFCFPFALQAQRKADYGIGGGVTSYIGDINPGILFYAPLPAGQFFYRYNFNPRQAIRANLLVGGVQASDYDFSNQFQQDRGASFTGIVGELGVTYEFNFFPYSSDGKRFDYSPYLSAGAGLAYHDAEFTNPSPDAFQRNFFPVIPFSFGFRINLFKKVGLEAEYGFRKTFYDIFDGLNDSIDPDHYGTIHNNDWYSFAGISITWKIMSRLEVCPVYNDNVSKKKRK